MAGMQTMDSALRHITDHIRAASSNGTALRICGGGSKDFYGNHLEGELLDTRGLSGILSYEPTELVVTVGAGTPLAELEALLAEHGQCLAFEPPHFAWSSSATATHAEPLGERAPSCGTADGSKATIGGMVAAGLSGPARASAGAVREYVLGLHLVNGLGEELVFGGQVMKNVAGYDVSRMMVGSMGTLGLITEVSLKVLPVAPAEATLVFAMDQASALECLHRWGGQRNHRKYGPGPAVCAAARCRGGGGCGLPEDAGRTDGPAHGQRPSPRRLGTVPQPATAFFCPPA